MERESEPKEALYTEDKKGTEQFGQVEDFRSHFIGLPKDGERIKADDKIKDRTPEEMAENIRKTGKLDDATRNTLIRAEQNGKLDETLAAINKNLKDSPYHLQSDRRQSNWNDPNKVGFEPWFGPPTAPDGRVTDTSVSLHQREKVLDSSTVSSVLSRSEPWSDKIQRPVQNSINDSYQENEKAARLSKFGFPDISLDSLSSMPEAKKIGQELRQGVDAETKKLIEKALRDDPQLQKKIDEAMEKISKDHAASKKIEIMPLDDAGLRKAIERMLSDPQIQKKLQEYEAKLKK